jgi:hypothetical protein
MQAEARLLIEAEYSWQSLAKVYESILEVA